MQFCTVYMGGMGFQVKNSSLSLIQVQLLCKMSASFKFLAAGNLVLRPTRILQSKFPVSPLKLTVAFASFSSFSFRM